MLTFPLLSIIVFLPLLGAIFLLFIRSESAEVVAKNSYNVSLWISIFNFLFSVLLVFIFMGNTTVDIFQFVRKSSPHLSEIYTSFATGVDGISIFFILLTSLIFPLFLICIGQKKENIKIKCFSLLLLEFFMLAAFSSLNIFLICVFMESAILLAVLYISFSKQLFSLDTIVFLVISAFLFLFAIIGIHKGLGSSDIMDLTTGKNIETTSQLWIWSLLFISIAIKFSLFPFHNWFIKIAKQIPSHDLALLIQVLALSGGYILLRIALPLLPKALYSTFIPFYAFTSLSLIYMAFVAYAQTTLKGFFAYSFSAGLSIFLLSAISVPQTLNISGSFLILFSHAIVFLGFFLFLAQLEKIFKNITKKEICGLMKTLPFLSIVFCFLLLSNIGIIGTAGFVGKFITVMAEESNAPYFLILMTFSSVIILSYSVKIINFLFSNTLEKNNINQIKSKLFNQKIQLLPIIIILFWIGIFPSHILNISKSSLNKISSVYSQNENIESDLTEDTSIKEQENVVD